MVANELSRKIVFEKFDIDSDELIVAKEITEKYSKKIQNFVEYDEIKLEMKSHSKINGKHFEIKGHVLFKNLQVLSNAEGREIIPLVEEVMKKMLQEIEHKIRKH